MRQTGGNRDILKPPFPSTVQVGGIDKDHLLQNLREQGVELNDAAKELFRDHRFETLRQNTIVDIQLLSVSDLGFAKGATYSRITESARNVGLMEYPLELGPHLRLQFLGQPEGSIGFPATPQSAPPGSITVATSPLDDTDETPKGFYLRRIDSVLWLGGYRSWSCHVWNPCDVFVFAKSF